MNLLILSGNLGQDATLRHLPNGTPVASFSLPAKSGWGDNEKLTWVRCSYFGKRAESVSPYLKKGQLVNATGEFYNSEYEKDGVTRTSAEMRVNNVELCGKRSDSNDTQIAPQYQAQTSAKDFDDDIPFANPYKRKEYLV